MNNQSVKSVSQGASLVVQWLRLCTPNVEGLGSIPGGETKTPYVTQGPKRRRGLMRVVEDYPAINKEVLPRAHGSTQRTFY